MKTTLKTIFSLKKVDYCIFDPKIFEVKKKLFKNTAKRLPIKMHVYRQKSFQLYKRLVRNNEFEK